MDIQVSHYNLLKREFFPHWIFLAPLSKIDHKYRGLFLDSHSIPLIYISILISLPHCLDYCSFVVKFSNWEMWVLQFPLLFLKIILAIMGPLHFFMNFKISLSISAKKKKKATEVLVGTAWNLQINLGSIAILTILSFNSWIYKIKSNLSWCLVILWDQSTQICSSNTKHSRDTWLLKIPPQKKWYTKRWGLQSHNISFILQSNALCKFPKQLSSLSPKT